VLVTSKADDDAFLNFDNLHLVSVLTLTQGCEVLEIGCAQFTADVEVRCETRVILDDASEHFRI